MSAYKKLLAENMEPHNQLSITVEESGNIYLFYDTVHLVKNVRNNLLGRKRFIFPSYPFIGFSKDTIVQGRAIPWKLLHDTHEKDEFCISTLRKASILTKQVSHIFMKYFHHVKLSFQNILWTTICNNFIWCSQVLHPGDHKQSVSTALAIFHETTIAALVSYFPDLQDSA